MKKALKIYLYAWAGLIALFALFVLFPTHNFLASKPDNIEKIIKLDLPDIAEAKTSDNLDRGASHWNYYEHSIQFEEAISANCIKELESRCQKDSADWSKNEAEGYYVYHDEGKDELYGVSCRIYKERACISYLVDEDEGMVAGLLLVVYLHIVLIWGFVLIVIAIDRKRRGNL